MWFCFNDAFVSVVQSTKDPDTLLVRARSYAHLKHIFGDTKWIHITPKNDYRYRVFCTKPEWAAIVNTRISDINYSNFKDSVREDKLHHLYEKFWFDHMVFQNGKNWFRRKTINLFAGQEKCHDTKAPGDIKSSHGTEDSRP